MYKHTTNEVVMIRPVAFAFNAETAVNNAYQNNDDTDPKIIQEKALAEFDGLVAKLEERGVKVNVLEDTPTPATPDSIFPNNWFSTHEGGLMVVYPMFADNRQEEIYKFRNTVEDIAEKKAGEHDFTIIDYSRNKARDLILEGTGSLVIDRKNRVAYCSLSPRADERLFEKWCKETDHKPCAFVSYQDDTVIYHTNILMGIGTDFALIGLDQIREEDRERVRKSLEDGGNEIIELTADQLKAGAGNCIELTGSDGKNFLVMSTQAYESLRDDQVAAIEKHLPIVHSDIRTIEFYGGGSARCTIAEIF
ncbi:MAG: arginine deiminase-related protein [Tissierellia bacterium]|nr:arginine deiminase-related protein [Tissierellia bacterium]